MTNEEFNARYEGLMREKRMQALQRTREQLALMGVGSPIFKALREELMERDPGFRERVRLIEARDA